MQRNLVIACSQIHNTYHRPSDAIVRDLETTRSAFNMVYNNIVIDERMVLCLRDLEIMCRVVGNKANVDINNVGELLNMLGVTSESAYAKAYGRALMEYIMHDGAILNNLKVVANDMERLRGVVKRHEGSINIADQLNASQAQYVVGVLLESNQKARMIGQYLVEKFFEYEVLQQGIPYEQVGLSKWMNWSDKVMYAYNQYRKEKKVGVQGDVKENTMNVKNNTNMSVKGHEDKPTVQPLSEEEEYRLRVQQEIEKLKARGYKNVQEQNGVLYDMDAIAMGYHEMARIGEVKRKKKKKENNGGGFFSKLFGRK